jgi:hypothetical protein
MFDLVTPIPVAWQLWKSVHSWIQAVLLSRVEAWSTTSTVALRVLGGDKKGSLESETVKYGRESHGTRTPEWLRCHRPAAVVNDRPVLSSERAPYINKPATVWLVVNPQMGALFQDRLADWPSVVT